MLNAENRIRLGFWGAAFVGIVFGLATIVASKVVDSSNDLAFRDASQLIAIEKLRVGIELEGRLARSFMLTGAAPLRGDFELSGTAVDGQLAVLRGTLTAAGERAHLDRVAEAQRRYRQALRGAMEVRARSDDVSMVADVFERDVQPVRDELDGALTKLIELQEEELERATAAAREAVTRTYQWLGAAAVIMVGLAGLLGWQLTRAMRALRQKREELADALQRVEHVNRELDAFAGRIAHDLRNALAPIPILTDVLRSAPPERRGPLADKLQRALDNTLGMIDGLLAFSRSAAPPTGARCSVRDAVDDVLEQLAPARQAADAEIERDVQEGTIAVSRALLSVLLANLVGNALKFVKGQDVRRVELSASFDAEGCEIVVADTGPGIPEPALARIFEPFYRAPGTSQPGTGIGLATVRRIVDAHAGTIHVESRTGRGTVFRVRLPGSSQRSTISGQQPPGGDSPRLTGS